SRRWWCSSTGRISRGCVTAPNRVWASADKAGGMALTQQEAFARIRLLRSPHIGPISYAQLLGRWGSAVAALEVLPDLAARGGRPYRAAPAARIEEEITAVRKAGARYLFHDSADYPALLPQIDSAPPILTVR